ncbi:hypothetical protein BC941DRAFT_440278 [Chlamydoabsidia padenii]|nr:hypothetical protein BC941DRAFT_440278 [Chlamydoabsidia padenii]
MTSLWHGCQLPISIMFVARAAVILFLSRMTVNTCLVGEMSQSCRCCPALVLSGSGSQPTTWYLSTMLCLDPILSMLVK